eukprot:m.377617 g.377617  ORF g.377617 m.377617 type:complete len:59 (+) comp87937_c0_seq1:109-285(+)
MTRCKPIGAIDEAGHTRSGRSAFMGKECSVLRSHTTLQHFVNDWSREMVLAPVFAFRG